MSKAFLSFFYTKKNSNKNLIFFIILCIILSRLIFILIDIFGCLIYKQKIGFLEFISRLNIGKNDCENYNNIILYGYKENWFTGFLPLFPIFMKFFCLVFNTTSTYVLAFFLNTLIFIPSCFIFYKYVSSTRRNDGLPFLALLLLIFGPYSFYTMQLMSESLFIFLLSLCLYFTSKRNYFLSGLFGMFLTATKVTGIFIILIMLIVFLKDYLAKEKNKSFKSFMIALFSNSNLILGIALAPLGFISFMLYTQITKGDGFAYIHAQNSPPFCHSIKYNFFYLLINDLNNNRVALVLIVLTCFALCLYLIFEKKSEESIIPLLAMLTAHNWTLNGIQRYSFGSLTVLLAFLDFIYANLNGEKRKLALGLCLIILFIFNISLFQMLLFNYQQFIYILC